MRLIAPSALFESSALHAGVLRPKRYDLEIKHAIFPTKSIKSGSFLTGSTASTGSIEIALTS